jgi:hypothetical protein
MAEAGGRAGPEASGVIVRQIDHLVVPVSDPVASALAFAELVGLSTAGPQQQGTFASTMFYLGNVSLEIGHFPDYDGPLDRIMSIAFEPAPLASAADELDRRRLAHGPPARVDGPMGWTTMGVNGLLDDNVGVFLCEYTFDRAPEERAAILAQFGRLAESIDDRRRWARDELQGQGGGALGIDAVTELVIATPNIAGERARWDALLAPAQAEREGEPCWRLGDGPALRLVAGERVGVAAVRVAVTSLTRARRALHGQGVATTLVDGELRIDEGLGASIGLRLAE